ncbi:ABC-type Fe3+-citrate transport system%2C periplasmic component [uncultured Eubacterium sp.]|nr:ABC-type Fe3+-citrate transport system%2C periplasmic component [uncultured Eubacterium sp.]
MKKKWKKPLLALLVLCLTSMTVLTGCGGSAGGSDDDTKGAPQISGLTYESTMELDYAEAFDVYRYQGGYSLIDVHDDARYLVVPEGKEPPADLDKEIIVIKQPVANIYLGATSAMALFDAIDGLDSIKMTGLKASGWSVKAAAQAMKEGSIVYAGKYNQPDYELILDSDCGLAIESTMIYHCPEVKEMLEDLGIPVLVDYSSYEPNPLGRTEWIKLYGVICGREKEAESFFAKQEKVINSLTAFKNTEKTVAFFYVTTDGKVVVRRSADYVPTMIEMAGGRYVFKNLSGEDDKASISMTMESFYDQAVDADYIVYNGSIDSTVKSLDDLISKDEIFQKFKAVKSGNCFTTGSSMYQRTDVVSNMIMDFHKVLTEDSQTGLKFLTKLE